jgi:NIPSNAP
VRISFDLYVLKSWDGDSPQYGPDRLKITVDGHTLFDNSLSNNFKVERQGSSQDYPRAGSAPQTAAKSANTLGYDFFGDAIYRFKFTSPHRENSLVLEFASDLFEGKGTNDESWGLDNMTVEVVDAKSAQLFGNRVFEIRTYVTEPGKLDDLLARFRDHTTKLFEKHGIENVGYWVPADGPHAEDTLIYVVAHPSREAAKKNWDAFIADPEWHQARDASEASGKIVKKVESVYVHPADFSPLK